MLCATTDAVGPVLMVERASDSAMSETARWSNGTLLSALPAPLSLPLPLLLGGKERSTDDAASRSACDVSVASFLLAPTALWITAVIMFAVLLRTSWMEFVLRSSLCSSETVSRRIVATWRRCSDVVFERAVTNARLFTTIRATSFRPWWVVPLFRVTWSILSRVFSAAVKLLALSSRLNWRSKVDIALCLHAD